MCTEELRAVSSPEIKRHFYVGLMGQDRLQYWPVHSADTHKLKGQGHRLNTSMPAGFAVWTHNSKTEDLSLKPRI